MPTSLNTGTKDIPLDFAKQLTKIVNEGKRDLLETYDLSSINLRTPQIISFVKECKKKGHDIDYYNNILDLIKGVYRDVF